MATREWIDETLGRHNKYREIHLAPPLEWSEECYQAAKLQADACAARGKLERGNASGPRGAHGQNLFQSSGARPKDAIKAWYAEHKKYDFVRSVGANAPHFSQLVWAGTTHVGLASSDDEVFVVANYWPAGNEDNAFTLNVSPAVKQEKAAELIAGSEVQKLGMHFSTLPPNPIVVKKVTPGSWAAEMGVEVGDLIMEVNHVRVIEMTAETFRQYMAERPLTLTLPDADLEFATLKIQTVLRMLKVRQRLIRMRVQRSRKKLLYEAGVNTREQLIRAVFGLLDVSKDGNLDEHEMLQFIRLLDLVDGDEEELELYAELCSAYGWHPSKGLDLKKFTELVNDTSDDWYRDDDQLAQFYEKLTLESSMKPRPGRRGDLGRGCMELVCDLKTTKTGMKLSMPPYALEVKEVAPGTWAHEKGIEVGDTFMEVNGKPVAGVSALDLKKILQQRPLRIRIASEDEHLAALRLQRLLRGRMGRKFAKNVGAKLKQREELLCGVFKIMDWNRDGFLDKRELLYFVRVMDFSGSDEEWFRVYPVLCSEYGWDEAQGVDFKDFANLVNDKDDDWYCTSDQLQVLLDKQLSFVAALRIQALIRGKRARRDMQEMKRKRETEAQRRRSQQRGELSRKIFEVLDVNRDGKLSAGETFPFILHLGLLETMDSQKQWAQAFSDVGAQYGWNASEGFNLQQFQQWIGNQDGLYYCADDALVGIFSSLESKARNARYSASVKIQTAHRGKVARRSLAQMQEADKLRKQERMALTREIFLMLDRNGDGLLQRRELFLFSRSLEMIDEEEEWNVVFPTLCHTYRWTDRSVDFPSFQELIDSEGAENFYRCTNEQLAVVLDGLKKEAAERSVDSGGGPEREAAALRIQSAQRAKIARREVAVIRQRRAESQQKREGDDSDADFEPLEVIAGKDDEKLGMGFKGYPPGIVQVAMVRPGTWADSNGIKANDFIASINEEDLEDMHRDRFKELIASRPLRFLIEPPFTPSGSEDEEEKLFRLERKQLFVRISKEKALARAKQGKDNDLALKIDPQQRRATLRSQKRKSAIQARRQSKAQLSQAKVVTTADRAEGYVEDQEETAADSKETAAAEDGAIAEAPADREIRARPALPAAADTSTTNTQPKAAPTSEKGRAAAEDRAMAVAPADREAHARPATSVAASVQPTAAAKPAKGRTAAEDRATLEAPMDREIHTRPGVSAAPSVSIAKTLPEAAANSAEDGATPMEPTDGKTQERQATSAAASARIPAAQSKTAANTAKGRTAAEDRAMPEAPADREGRARPVTSASARAIGAGTQRKAVPHSEKRRAAREEMAMPEAPMDRESHVRPAASLAGSASTAKKQPKAVANSERGGAAVQDRESLGKSAAVAASPAIAKTSPTATAEGWTERQELLQTVFHMYDSDKNGRLNAAECLNFARSLGFPGSRDEWSFVYRELCADYAVTEKNGIDLQLLEKLTGNADDPTWYCTNQQLRVAVEDQAATKVQKIFRRKSVNYPSLHVQHYQQEGRRNRIVEHIFCLLDRDRDSFVNAREFYPFARCFEFPGDLEQWREIFAEMVDMYKWYTIGVDLESFAALIDDHGDTWYASDDTLEEILEQLELELAAVRIQKSHRRRQSLDLPGNTRVTGSEQEQFAEFPKRQIAQCPAGRLRWRPLKKAERNVVPKETRGQAPHGAMRKHKPDNESRRGAKKLLKDYRIAKWKLEEQKQKVEEMRKYSERVSQQQQHAAQGTASHDRKAAHAATEAALVKLKNELNNLEEQLSIFDSFEEPQGLQNDFDAQPLTVGEKIARQRAHAKDRGPSGRVPAAERQGIQVPLAGQTGRELGKSARAHPENDSMFSVDIDNCVRSNSPKRRDRHERKSAAKAGQLPTAGGTSTTAAHGSTAGVGVPSANAQLGFQEKRSRSQDLRRDGHKRGHSRGNKKDHQPTQALQRDRHNVVSTPGASQQDRLLQKGGQGARPSVEIVLSLAISISAADPPPRTMRGSPPSQGSNTPEWSRSIGDSKTGIHESQMPVSPSAFQQARPRRVWRTRARSGSPRKSSRPSSPSSRSPLGDVSSASQVIPASGVPSVKQVGTKRARSTKSNDAKVVGRGRRAPSDEDLATSVRGCAAELEKLQALVSDLSSSLENVAVQHSIRNSSPALTAEANSPKAVGTKRGLL